MRQNNDEMGFGQPRRQFSSSLYTRFDIDQQCRMDKFDRRKDDKHVKAFYTARGPLQALLALPSQILFAIAGLFGLAHYARQIVHVSPRAATTLRKRDGAEVALSEWVHDNVRSLQGRFVPTWWLPKYVLRLPVR